MWWKNTNYYFPILIPSIWIYLIAGGTACSETGGYAGNEIDTVNSINDAESCQNLCQAHSQCKFWTWNKNHNYCKRQTGNSSGSCGENCVRGPRSCPGKNLNTCQQC